MARTIVVTGCTRGLGHALTEAFVKEGHAVAGCGRSADIIAGMQERYGGAHLFQTVDVTDAPAVAAFARAVEDCLGVPDLLVNNAGVINRNAPLWEVPPEEFGTVMDVNLKGVAHCLHAFVPGMVARGSGIIVNLSSGWGRSTSPEVAPYCASKWGIEGLSQAMAQELPSGMACVALNPGVIDTQMLRSCFGGSAGGHPDPEQWARKAAPYILGIQPSDSGQPLSVR
jgi:NAD(P)-dependent dehydrogenase (short-subunit alcohol dehydrogenase family)